MDAFVKRTRPAAKSRDEDAPGRSHGLPLARPAKRMRRDEDRGPAEGESEGSSSEAREGGEEGGSGAEADDYGRGCARVTDVEIVLPPTQTDAAAVAEYERLRSTQESRDKNAESGEGRRWIKGQSSIYVDAFNLALDTVLDEESQLFNTNEMEVFRQWRELNYEAQYLYVRLFLRKTAAWHRSRRLGYYADVSDPDAAIGSLQQPRRLPQGEGALSGEKTDAIPGLELEESSVGEAFTFADASADWLSTMEEAASLLHLDELKALARGAKVQGRNKAELIGALGRADQQQARLTALGLGRHNSGASDAPGDADSAETNGRAGARRQGPGRGGLMLERVLEMVGPCVRLSRPASKLFERVHLVFYRSTEWTEKSLTTVILAKMAKRNFPEYVVCRTSGIFASRSQLVEFEAAIRLEAEADGILESRGSAGEAGLSRIVDVFERVYPRWQALVAEERDKERAAVYEMGEGAYLRRFNPAHAYTRIMLKAMDVLGRRREHAREHGLLSELLDQKLFHLARRGAWYRRKALLEQHYMAAAAAAAAAADGAGDAGGGVDQRKKHWLRAAAATCEAGLQDPDCHVIHHYDLQKRLVRLERRLRVPRRLQHDFGHVGLARPVEVRVEGVQLLRRGAAAAATASTKTVWLDELGSGGACSVEAMCLSHFRAAGWKGYHGEGGVVRTLFAYLLYDIVFLCVPNVFQTAYQTCPLDLHTDGFFAARASELHQRLAQIANGEGERLLRGVWAREHARRPAAAGLDWGLDVEELAELVRCFEGAALAAVCKVMAQEYRQRGGGVPDLLLWRAGGEGEGEGAGEGAGEGGDDAARRGAARGEVMFAEVKSANDRLSDTQRLWMHVLAGAGIKVALCRAVAREVREAA